MDTEFAAMLRPFLKYAGSQPITDVSALRDLGLDSMQEVELLFSIEDTYGVQLPDDQLTDATFATAGSLWNAVRRLSDKPLAESS
jgi:acyl carrier protein